ncbi:hypothetical protein [Streptomyces griseocarneus]|uniref:hypothetical protein n=1 Tax=Streptomyces griseocarneus TaxID=51201 RepID=UPI00167F1AF1|nr:hypothetical protein [Streptomyces griseocarneus]MBZ6475171.1 hypothetical protein [Streptomyces griseocarneus]GHG61852.1 hypothetical protein GCM10018779_30090 [Streptomyces griseocarneus]
MREERSARRTRSAAGLALAAVMLTATAGCSDDSGKPGDGHKIASAASSAAASLASQGAAALASATAEARRKLDEVHNGVDAKGEVTLGTPTTGSDGRATVEVVAHNTADSAKSFAVLVQFKDTDGNLLDAAVVTLSDVAPGKDGKATVHGTHKVSGDIRAEVGRALRY